ncbi:MAG: beta-propeller fold lactonase family protein, partial [Bacillota bacterium]
MKKEYIVYTGGYSHKTSSEGIYVFRLDMIKGEFVKLSSHSECINPTFLALSPDRRFLYAVHEVKEYAGISAYAVDPDNGDLRWLNTLKAPGFGTCHLAVGPSGKFVAAANYDSGSIFTC